MSKVAKTKHGKLGRPVAEDPKIYVSVRFPRELIQKLDAWDKENGTIGRSAAIRQLLVRALRAENNS